MKKRIVLCADDFGQALPISEAILALIRKDRINATSCLVNMPGWEEHAKWLIPFQDHIDIGLHFNLTEGKALSKKYVATYGDYFFSLPVLLRKVLLRNISLEVIEAEYLAQIHKFRSVLGFMPQFVDAHHHVHQFPLIRDAFINIYCEQLPHKPYVRLSNPKLKWSDLMTELKKFVIYNTGTRGFKKQLIQHQIPHNQSFAGIYSFAKYSQYPQLFAEFLREISDLGIIMCHPASISTADTLGNARHAEYCYLASPQFLKDCYQHQAVLTRFNGVLSF